MLDDRIERQFAVVAEVLEAASSEGADRLPHVRDLLHSGAFFWNEMWETLYLEFVLYARRNPEAAAKLAPRADQEQAFVQQMIEHEYAIAGRGPRYPHERPREPSRLRSSPGSDRTRLNNPRAVRDTLLDTVLDFLSESMGIEGTPLRPER